MFWFKKNNTMSELDLDFKISIECERMDRIIRLADEHNLNMHKFLSSRLSERDLLDFHKMNNDYSCKVAML